jgi:hypothetical protein
MSELDAETVATQLLVVLDEALLGASGPSTYFVANTPDSGFLGALAQVDAETASRVIGGRSIAAHANHVAFAMEASVAWIAGDRAPRDWNESWAVVGVDDEGWELLLARLGQQYRALRRGIESTAGRDKEALVEAVGSVAHIAYHLGSVWQKLAVARAPGPSES